MTAIINILKPVTSIIDIAKVSFGETWGSILTTWAAETRTWMATGSLFSDTAKPSTSISNVAKPA